MIFHRALFYKLADIAIQSFFDSILKNLNRVNIDGGTVIKFSDLKIGDRFKKLTLLKYGYAEIYYDVTIKPYEKSQSYKAYALRSLYRQSFSYIEAFIKPSSIDGYKSLFEEGENYYEDFIIVKPEKFNKWLPDIKKNLSFSYDVLYETDCNSFITILVWD